MTPISICIIAKNEEKHIDNCLSAIQKHLRNYPHEIVLVDTGCSDKTVEIAKEYTDKIYFFQWIGDFSAARNHSIQCASNDWILVLDCDEYITQLDIPSLDYMTSHHPSDLGMITIQNHYQTNRFDNTHTDLMERLFNRKFYHYESIIHEQLRPNTHTIKPKRFDIALTVDHCGYAGTKEELIFKFNRNIELLLKMLKENPQDAYLYFQIGQAYNSIQDAQNACIYFEKGLEYINNPKLQYVKMMVIDYGYTLLDLQRQQDALCLANLYDDFCQTADFVCLMGTIYLRNGMVADALREFQKATTIKTAHVGGTNSFIPFYNIGCINEVLGNIDTAIEMYQKCGEFPPAQERFHLLIKSPEA